MFWELEMKIPERQQVSVTCRRKCREMGRYNFVYLSYRIEEIMTHTRNNLVIYLYPREIS